MLACSGPSGAVGREGSAVVARLLLAVTCRDVVAVEQAAHALVVGEVDGPALLVVR
jgi:hypothetical protein